MGSSGNTAAACFGPLPVMGMSLLLNIEERPLLKLPIVTTVCTGFLALVDTMLQRGWVSTAVCLVMLLSFAAKDREITS